MPSFKINPSGVRQLKASGLVGGRGSDRGVAKLFGVDPAVLHRALHGQEPSSRLIAGALSALGMDWFQVLFTVTDERKRPCMANTAQDAASLTSRLNGAHHSSARPAGTPGPTFPRSA